MDQEPTLDCIVSEDIGVLQSTNSLHSPGATQL